MNIHSVAEQLSRDDDTGSVDGEGVWAPDIEGAFHEGLKLFPPCGRRKHILQEEGGGKMYGRNELIARHILMRTGKVRTRKQVSSHIQVLNRRKHKIDTQSTSASTSSDTPSPSSGFSFVDSSPNDQHHVNPFNRQNNNNQTATNVTLPDGTSYNNHINHMQTTTMSSNGLITQHAYHLNQHHLHHHHHSTNDTHLNDFHDFWNDGPIVTQKIKLVEFSAFIEYSNFPNQATLARSNTSLAPLLGAITIRGQQSTQLANHNGNQHQQNSNSVYNVVHNNHLPTQLNSSNNIYDTNGYDRLSSNLIANTNGSAIVPFSNSINGGHQQDRNDTHPFNSNHHQLFNGLQTTSTSTGSGIKRHTYVKIDNSQSIGRQTNKLERIDITQIQDKFPEICELFLRSSPYSFYLVKFWANINSDYEYNIEDQNTNFGISTHFETIERYEDLTVSTKACSYGCQVVEKVDKIYSVFDSSKQRYSYKINNSPMCEFMIRFIKKLRQLPETSQMNSVLENFTVLQVITTDSTSEILMCLAYVFEVASAEHNGTQYHVYRLSKD